MPRLLVIDDQQATLDLLGQLFRREGYEVDLAGDGDSALRLLEETEYDVVFTDLRLGYPHDGLEMLDAAKRLSSRTQVVIMTAFTSVESSALAMKAGAYDYITKPFNKEELVLLASRAAEKSALARRVETLERQVEAEGLGGKPILGSSKAMLRVMRLVGQVARTSATVLITGESGTGKELVAMALHRLSPRADRAFVAVNCGAIPENLQESEFFGHVKGAFTGASRTKTGLFEQAHKGTLFLDEVGETSLATQVKLLRFLQSGEVRKVGDNDATVVDVRLVTATNRDLMEMIAEKTFREDLYYRLNIVAVELPPLREREADLQLLAQHFVKKYARKTGNQVSGLTPAAMAALEAHNWPGNVRELENAMERAVTLTRGPVIDVDDLPRLERPPLPLDRAALISGRYPAADWAAASGEWSAADLRSPNPGFGGHRQRPPQGGDPWPAGPTISGRFPAPVPAAPASQPGRDPEAEAFPSLKEIEREHIIRALRQFGGSRARTCRALGIGKATLWRKIKLYEIDL